MAFPETDVWRKSVIKPVTWCRDKLDQHHTNHARSKGDETLKHNPYTIVLNFLTSTCTFTVSTARPELGVSPTPMPPPPSKPTKVGAEE
jgi:hypothetical protein